MSLQQLTLNSLKLTNFKNIADVRLGFSRKLNCFIGNNGMGKSNLLDAVYYLSFCKSFTGMTDAQVLRNGEEFMMMQGEYTRNSLPETLSVGMNKGRRKSFRRGAKEYPRLSQHIGKFPLVMVSPADMSLVNGTGEERRRFMDMIISQTDARYLDDLIRYQQALEQRNRLLRDGFTDPALFEAIEAQMCAAAAYICTTRREWIQGFSKLFGKYYTSVAGEGETASLGYLSHMAEPGVSLSTLLDERRGRDAILKYTTAGPHRDDIEMLLAGMPVRRIASQGQAKTYTIALRFAQYEFLAHQVNMSPLLLLDDIFDKLDAQRVERIVSVVAGDAFGQIFITDTNRKHIDDILRQSAGEYSMWNVENGVFTPLSYKL